MNVCFSKFYLHFLLLVLTDGTYRTIRYEALAPGGVKENVFLRMTNGARARDDWWGLPSATPSSRSTWPVYSSLLALRLLAYLW